MLTETKTVSLSSPVKINDNKYKLLFSGSGYISSYYVCTAEFNECCNHVVTALCKIKLVNEKEHIMSRMKITLYLE